MLSSIMGRMKPAPVVVGLGELLWDNLPYGRCRGGAPANFACQAGQLGAETTSQLVSDIGLHLELRNPLIDGTGRNEPAATNLD